MQTLLMGAELFMCVLVMIAAADYLRRIRPVDQPLLSISFYLVAIGAFGVFVTTLQGAWVNPFSVLVHAGVALYAWTRRHHLFEASA